MDIRAVIFDFDETVADSLPGRAESLRLELTRFSGQLRNRVVESLETSSHRL